MDSERAQRFANEWYAAWNAHDLETILDHYAADVEVLSPLVAALAGGDDGRISGKEALRRYFAAGLEKYPDLQFEPIDLFVGVESIVLHYRRTGADRAAEVVFLDDGGKVSRYFAHYEAEPASDE